MGLPWQRANRKSQTPPAKEAWRLLHHNLPFFQHFVQTKGPQVLHFIQSQSRRVFHRPLGSSAACLGSLRRPPWVAAQTGAQQGPRWAQSQGLPAVFLTVCLHLIALFSLLVFVSFSHTTSQPVPPLGFKFPCFLCSLIRFLEIRAGKTS